MSVKIKDDKLLKEKSVLHRREKLMFNGKEAELIKDGVEILFKDHSGSSMSLVHRRQGSNYHSNWVSIGDKEWNSREVKSGNSLNVTNPTLENKLIALAKDFASKDEVIDFLNKAGEFIKQNYNSIFKLTDSLERGNKEQALLSIHHHLQGKHNIVIDKDSYDLCIYDEKTGIHIVYDAKQFSQFLKKVLGKELFEDEVKKLMGLFNEITEENQNHIAFNNCLLNIDNLVISRFDSNKFIKFKVPYNWNPSAHSAYFEQKLYEIFDDRNKFQTFLQIVGYLFVKGNPHNKLFLLIGDGANGKSLLMQLISAIFINGSAAVPLQDFKKDFGLQPLIGKRVNLLSDLPIATIEETGQIKAITGGDDITINRKFKEPITTKLGCKIVGAGNRLPKIMDDSYALWRRIVIIKLEKTFDGDNRDTKLINKLLNDKKGMEWLIYNSIQAYREIQETGWTEDTHREIRMEFIKSSDTALYAAEHLFKRTTNPENFISREDIKNTINDFLYKNRLRIPVNNNEYYDAVKRLGAKESQKRIDGNKVHGFRYIK